MNVYDLQRDWLHWVKKKVTPPADMDANFLIFVRMLANGLDV